VGPNCESDQPEFSNEEFLFSLDVKTSYPPPVPSSATPTQSLQQNFKDLISKWECDIQNLQSEWQPVELVDYNSWMRLKGKTMRTLSKLALYNPDDPEEDSEEETNSKEEHRQLQLQNSEMKRRLADMQRQLQEKENKTVELQKRLNQEEAHHVKTWLDAEMKLQRASKRQELSTKNFKALLQKFKARNSKVKSFRQAGKKSM